jgi:hypothetical protein
MPQAMPLADLSELSDGVLAELRANDDALLKPLLLELWTALKVSKAMRCVLLTLLSPVICLYGKCILPYISYS